MRTIDRLTPEQRRRAMTNVRSKDTGIEVAVRSALHARGLRFRKHVRHLPGTPDIVFSRARVAVFVDGDFWHGWRFPTWRHKLSTYWDAKIERNRRRDRRNFARLRRQGWLVVRVWEHDVLADVDRVADRIENAVRARGS
ncbi:MAG: very short patch repair endonuclease [Chloroflexi bacterium]|nr:very short patch repair endonuclease [Chloroflexota bacterium]MYD98110.1 very short patch repair endonuclease [Gammaproteobacteria bacterium]